MGWKGTLRSLQAASRAADRAAQRRHRELQRQQKNYEKMQALERAAYEVEVFDNHIHRITSVHKECFAELDWLIIANESAPEKPIQSYPLETRAKHQAFIYKPGFFARLFKQEVGKRKKLAEQVAQARIKDEKDYQQKILDWQIQAAEWQKHQSLAQRVLRHEAAARLEVISELASFSDIGELGSSITFAIGDANVLEATLQVHSTTVIPAESKSLLSSGKLSVKKMPVGKFNELYQDYVCGCVMRIANELMGLLPEQVVVVTAVDKLLNTSTGHLENSPILSAIIPRATLAKLNLEQVDPSDAMRNFVHRMSFKKTAGFAAITQLKAEDITNAIRHEEIVS